MRDLEIVTASAPSSSDSAESDRFRNYGGEKAVSLDPNLAEGYKAEGLCYGAKGHITRALERI